MDSLNIDEVMALQMLGLPIKMIREMDLASFDCIYNEHPELEELIDTANHILDCQEQQGIVSISCQDAFFPRRLLEIGDDCPSVIHCKGNLALFKEDKAAAIIGARSADKEGIAKAYDLASQYSHDGYVFGRGLAYGCDTAAHIGCLDEGGETIAIVGNSLDICHPRGNKALEERILSNGGMMMSECAIRVKANPTRLVARSRLQAALSEIVILAQCPSKSGSLHTMSFARQYGKKCYAATFLNRTEANAGNYDLLDRGLCRALPEG